MKKILFLVIMIGMSLSGYAQDEFNNTFKPIPPEKPKEEKEIPPTEIPPKVTPPPVVVKHDPLEVDPKMLFNNPNVYKKPENTEGIYYRQNQFLGSFKTTSKTSKVRYRDAAFLDGDKVKIYLNYKEIVPSVVLDGEFKEFDFPFCDL